MTDVIIEKRNRPYNYYIVPPKSKKILFDDLKLQWCREDYILKKIYTWTTYTTLKFFKNEKRNSAYNKVTELSGSFQ